MPGRGVRRVELRTNDGWRVAAGTDSDICARLTEAIPLDELAVVLLGVPRLLPPPTARKTDGASRGKARPRPMDIACNVLSGMGTFRTT